MPKGITQEQVSAAADALVAGGENPTVEKVRAALGTGSPNTVTRMLDAWRTQLGGRLLQLSAIPGLPDEVGQAMRGLWHLAIEHAEGLLQASMTERRTELEAIASRLAEERVHWTAALAEAEAAVAQARMQRDLAEHACGTLDDQLRDSHTLRDDLQQQRDRLQALVDIQQADLQTLRAERGAMDAAMREERERLIEHVRHVEDRAHQQVDQARQETKALQVRLERMQRDLQQVQLDAENQRNDLRAEIRRAEQEAANQGGRATALEAALTQLRLSANKPASKKQGEAKRPQAKPRASSRPSLRENKRKGR